jgi:hypothetical protein
LFFAGIGVFAPPLAAAATWTVLERLRQTRHLQLAATVAVLVVAQLAWGAAINAPAALRRSAPLEDRQPVPVAMLDTIRRLPTDAKLAYACRPLEEATFAQPQLVSVDVHTRRRLVPMCFQADVTSPLVGGVATEAPNPSWPWAPQRAIYPDAAAQPSAAAIASFLRGNGIDYIYADRIHPNSLVPDAVLLTRIDGTELLQLP